MVHCNRWILLPLTKDISESLKIILKDEDDLELALIKCSIMVVCEHQVYCGKEKRSETVLARVTGCLRLNKNHCQKKKHHIYSENFFTGIPLLRIC